MQKIDIPIGATKVIIETIEPQVSFTIPETPNKPPTVTDGQPVTIQLPMNEVVISAAASDPDGRIEVIKWEQISGPSATILNPALLTTKATNLKEGDYLFRVSVTDDDGATASSTRSVTVKAGVVVPPPQGKTFPITSIPREESDYSRPGAGPIEWNGVEWDGSNALKLTPSKDTYERFNWFDFEDKAEGQYSWTKFDSYIKAAISKGKKFYMGGIMAVCDGCSGGRSVGGAQLGYPEYMHKNMQADPDVNKRDWIPSQSNKIWVPNWNSEFFLKPFENLLMAINKRLTDNDWWKHISMADIRGYGNYGEWHNYNWHWEQPKGRTATVATLKRIVDAHIKAFPNIPLTIISAAFDPGNASLMPPEFIYYALTAKNNWGPIGWRRDNWGAPGSDNHLVNNPGSYNGIPFKTLILEKWKTAPVTGEPTADYTETGDYPDLAREIALYHPVNIGNGNYSRVPPNATMAANLKAGYAKTGYRINIDSGSVAFKERLYITTNWNSNGTSPTYDSWIVEYTIDGWKAESKFNPKLLYGKLTFVDDFTLPSLPSGTYDLKVNIFDPTNKARTLPLHNIPKCVINL